MHLHRAWDYVAPILTQVELGRSGMPIVELSLWGDPDVGREHYTAVHYLMKSTTSLKILELNNYRMNGGDCDSLVLGMLAHFSEEAASLVKLSILSCHLDDAATLNFVQFMQGVVPVTDTNTATCLSLREIHIDLCGGMDMGDYFYLSGPFGDRDTGTIVASMLSRQSQTTSGIKLPTNGSQLQEMTILFSYLIGFLDAVESDNSIGQLPKLNVTDVSCYLGMLYWEDCLPMVTKLNELNLNFHKHVSRTELQAILSYFGTKSVIHTMPISCTDDPDRISAEMSKRLQASCSRNRVLPKLLATMP